MDIFGSVIDWLLDFIYEGLEWVFGLLPDSPIQNSGFVADLDNTFVNVMGYINYFVPIGTMLGITVVYLTAVAVWYVVRWFMRLAKYID